jgi:hypothetical protein
VIKPGWKRDVCPQCHMPGRVGERFGIGVPRDDGVRASMMEFRYGGVLSSAKEPMLILSADFCDNCGVLYAYEARGLVDKSIAYAAATLTSRCKFCCVPEGEVHKADCISRARRGHNDDPRSVP